MTGRKARKNQRIGSSRRNLRSQNKTDEQGTEDDFSQAAGEDNETKQTEFSAKTVNPSSDTSTADQVMQTSRAENYHQISFSESSQDGHVQSHEDSPTAAGKKRRMGSTRKSSGRYQAENDREDKQEERTEGMEEIQEEKEEGHSNSFSTPTYQLNELSDQPGKSDFTTASPTLQASTVDSIPHSRDVEEAVDNRATEEPNNSNAALQSETLGLLHYSYDYSETTVSYERGEGQAVLGDVIAQLERKPVSKNVDNSLTMCGQSEAFVTLEGNEEENALLNISVQRRKMGSTRKTLRGNRGEKGTDDKKEEGMEATENLPNKREHLQEVQMTSERQDEEREEQKWIKDGEAIGAIAESSVLSSMQSSATARPLLPQEVYQTPSDLNVSLDDTDNEGTEIGQQLHDIPADNGPEYSPETENQTEEQKFPEQQTNSDDGPQGACQLNAGIHSSLPPVQLDESVKLNEDEQVLLSSLDTKENDEASKESDEVGAFHDLSSAVINDNATFNVSVAKDLQEDSEAINATEDITVESCINAEVPPGGAECAMASGETETNSQLRNPSQAEGLLSSLYGMKEDNTEFGLMASVRDGIIISAGELKITGQKQQREPDIDPHGSYSILVTEKVQTGGDVKLCEDDRQHSSYTPETQSSPTNPDPNIQGEQLGISAGDFVTGENRISDDYLSEVHPVEVADIDASYEQGQANLFSQREEGEPHPMFNSSVQQDEMDSDHQHLEEKSGETNSLSMGEIGDGNEIISGIAEQEGAPQTEDGSATEDIEVTMTAETQRETNEFATETNQGEGGAIKETPSESLSQSPSIPTQFQSSETSTISEPLVSHDRTGFSDDNVHSKLVNQGTEIYSKSDSLPWRDATELNQPEDFSLAEEEEHPATPVQINQLTNVGHISNDISHPAVEPDPAADPTLSKEIEQSVLHCTETEENDTSVGRSREDHKGIEEAECIQNSETAVNVGEEEFEIILTVKDKLTVRSTEKAADVFESTDGLSANEYKMAEALMRDAADAEEKMSVGVKDVMMEMTHQENHSDAVKEEEMQQEFFSKEEARHHSFITEAQTGQPQDEVTFPITEERSRSPESAGVTDVDHYLLSTQVQITEAAETDTFEQTEDVTNIPKVQHQQDEEGSLHEYGEAADAKPKSNIHGHKRKMGSTRRARRGAKEETGEDRAERKDEVVVEGNFNKDELDDTSMSVTAEPEVNTQCLMQPLDNRKNDTCQESQDLLDARQDNDPESVTARHEQMFLDGLHETTGKVSTALGSTEEKAVSEGANRNYVEEEVVVANLEEHHTDAVDQEQEHAEERSVENKNQNQYEEPAETEEKQAYSSPSEEMLHPSDITKTQSNPLQDNSMSCLMEEQLRPNERVAAPVADYENVLTEDQLVEAVETGILPEQSNIPSSKSSQEEREIPRLSTSAQSRKLGSTRRARKGLKEQKNGEHAAEKKEDAEHMSITELEGNLNENKVEDIQLTVCTEAEANAQVLNVFDGSAVNEDTSTVNKQLLEVTQDKAEPQSVITGTETVFIDGVADSAVEDNATQESAEVTAVNQELKKDYPWGEIITSDVVSHTDTEGAQEKYNEEGKQESRNQDQNKEPTETEDAQNIECLSNDTKIQSHPPQDGAISCEKDTQLRPTESVEFTENPGADSNLVLTEDQHVAAAETDTLSGMRETNNPESQDHPKPNLSKQRRKMGSTRRTHRSLKGEKRGEDGTGKEEEEEADSLNFTEVNVEGTLKNEEMEQTGLGLITESDTNEHTVENQSGSPENEDTSRKSESILEQRQVKEELENALSRDEQAVLCELDVPTMKANKMPESTEENTVSEGMNRDHEEEGIMGTVVVKHCPHAEGAEEETLPKTEDLEQNDEPTQETTLQIQSVSSEELNVTEEHYKAPKGVALTVASPTDLNPISTDAQPKEEPELKTLSEQMTSDIPPSQPLEEDADPKFSTSHKRRKMGSTRRTHKGLKQENNGENSTDKEEEKQILGITEEQGAFSETELVTVTDSEVNERPLTNSSESTENDDTFQSNQETLRGGIEEDPRNLMAETEQGVLSTLEEPTVEDKEKLEFTEEKTVSTDLKSTYVEEEILEADLQEDHTNIEGAREDVKGVITMENKYAEQYEESTKKEETQVHSTYIHTLPEETEVNSTLLESNSQEEEQTPKLNPPGQRRKMGSTRRTRRSLKEERKGEDNAEKEEDTENFSVIEVGGALNKEGAGSIQPTVDIEFEDDMQSLKISPETTVNEDTSTVGQQLLEVTQDKAEPQSVITGTETVFIDGVVDSAVEDNATQESAEVTTVNQELKKDYPWGEIITSDVVSHTDTEGAQEKYNEEGKQESRNQDQNKEPTETDDAQNIACLSNDTKIQSHPPQDGAISCEKDTQLRPTESVEFTENPGADSNLVLTEDQHVAAAETDTLSGMRETNNPESQDHPKPNLSKQRRKMGSTRRTHRSLKGEKRGEDGTGKEEEEEADSLNFTEVNVEGTLKNEEMEQTGLGLITESNTNEHTVENPSVSPENEDTSRKSESILEQRQVKEELENALSRDEQAVLCDLDVPTMKANKMPESTEENALSEGMNRDHEEEGIMGAVVVEHCPHAEGAEEETLPKTEDLEQNDEPTQETTLQIQSVSSEELNVTEEHYNAPKGVALTVASPTDLSLISMDVQPKEEPELKTLSEQSEMTSDIPPSQPLEEDADPKFSTSHKRRKMGSTRRTHKGLKQENNGENSTDKEEEKQILGITEEQGAFSETELVTVTDSEVNERPLTNSSESTENDDTFQSNQEMLRGGIEEDPRNLMAETEQGVLSTLEEPTVEDKEKLEFTEEKTVSTDLKSTYVEEEILEADLQEDHTNIEGAREDVKGVITMENKYAEQYEESTKKEETQVHSTYIHTLPEETEVNSTLLESNSQEEEQTPKLNPPGQRRKMGSTRRTRRSLKEERKGEDNAEKEEDTENFSVIEVGGALNKEGAGSIQPTVDIEFEDDMQSLKISPETTVNEDTSTVGQQLLEVTQDKAEPQSVITGTETVFIDGVVDSAVEDNATQESAEVTTVNQELKKDYPWGEIITSDVVSHTDTEGAQEKYNEEGKQESRNQDQNKEPTETEDAQNIECLSNDTKIQSHPPQDGAISCEKDTQLRPTESVEFTENPGADSNLVLTEDQHVAAAETDTLSGMRETNNPESQDHPKPNLSKQRRKMGSTRRTHRSLKGEKRGEDRTGKEEEEEADSLNFTEVNVEGTLKNEEMEQTGLGLITESDTNEHTVENQSGSPENEDTSRKSESILEQRQVKEELENALSRDEQAVLCELDVPTMKANKMPESTEENTVSEGMNRDHEEEGIMGTVVVEHCPHAEGAEEETLPKTEDLEQNDEPTQETTLQIQSVSSEELNVTEEHYKAPKGVALTVASPTDLNPISTDAQPKEEPELKTLPEQMTSDIPPSQPLEEDADPKFSTSHKRRKMGSTRRTHKGLKQENNGENSTDKEEEKQILGITEEQGAFSETELVTVTDSEVNERPLTNSSESTENDDTFQSNQETLRGGIEEDPRNLMAETEQGVLSTLEEPTVEDKEKLEFTEEKTVSTDLKSTYVEEEILEADLQEDHTDIKGAGEDVKGVITMENKYAEQYEESTKKEETQVHSTYIHTLPEETEVNSTLLESNSQEEEQTPKLNPPGQRRKMGSTRRTRRSLKEERKGEDNAEKEEDTENFSVIEVGGALNKEGAGSIQPTVDIEFEDDMQSLKISPETTVNEDTSTVGQQLLEVTQDKAEPQSVITGTETVFIDGVVDSAVEDNATQESAEVTTVNQELKKDYPWGEIITSDVVSHTDTEGAQEKYNEEGKQESRNQDQNKEPTETDDAQNIACLSNDTKIQSHPPQDGAISCEKDTQLRPTESVEFTENPGADSNLVLTEDQHVAAAETDTLSGMRETNNPESQDHPKPNLSKQRRKMGSTRRTHRSLKGEKRGEDGTGKEEEEEADNLNFTEVNVEGTLKNEEMEQTGLGVITESNTNEHTVENPSVSPENEDTSRKSESILEQRQVKEELENALSRDEQAVLCDLDVPTMKANKMPESTEENALSEGMNRDHEEEGIMGAVVVEHCPHAEGAEEETLPKTEDLEQNDEPTQETTLQIQSVSSEELNVTEEHYNAPKGVALTVASPTDLSLISMDVQPKEEPELKTLSEQSEMTSDIPPSQPLEEDADPKFSTSHKRRKMGSTRRTHKGLKQENNGENSTDKEEEKQILGITEEQGAFSETELVTVTDSEVNERPLTNSSESTENDDTFQSNQETLRGGIEEDPRNLMAETEQGVLSTLEEPTVEDKEKLEFTEEKTVSTDLKSTYVEEEILEADLQEDHTNIEGAREDVKGVITMENKYAEQYKESTKKEETQVHSTYIHTLPEETEVNSTLLESNSQEEEQTPKLNPPGQRRKMGSTRRTRRSLKEERKGEDNAEKEEDTENFSVIEVGGALNKEGAGSIQPTVDIEFEDDMQSLKISPETTVNEGTSTVGQQLLEVTQDKAEPQSVITGTETVFIDGVVDSAVEDNATQESAEVTTVNQELKKDYPWGEIITSDVVSHTDTEGAQEKYNEEGKQESRNQDQNKEPTETDDAQNIACLSNDTKIQSHPPQDGAISCEKDTQLRPTESVEFTENPGADSNLVLTEDQHVAAAETDTLSGMRETNNPESQDHPKPNLSKQRRKMGSTRRTHRSLKGEKRGEDGTGKEEEEEADNLNFTEVNVQGTLKNEEMEQTGLGLITESDTNEHTVENQSGSPENEDTSRKSESILEQRQVKEELENALSRDEQAVLRELDVPTMKANKMPESTEENALSEGMNRDHEEEGIMGTVVVEHCLHAEGAEEETLPKTEDLEQNDEPTQETTLQIQSVSSEELNVTEEHYKAPKGVDLTVASPTDLNLISTDAQPKEEPELKTLSEQSEMTSDIPPSQTLEEDANPKFSTSHKRRKMESTRRTHKGLKQENNGLEEPTVEDKEKLEFTEEKTVSTDLKSTYVEEQILEADLQEDHTDIKGAGEDVKGVITMENKYAEQYEESTKKEETQVHSTYMHTLPEETEVNSTLLESNSQEEEQTPKLNPPGQRRKMGSTRRTRRSLKEERKGEDNAEKEEVAEQFSVIEVGQFHNKEEVRDIRVTVDTEFEGNEQSPEISFESTVNDDSSKESEVAPQGRQEEEKERQRLFARTYQSVLSEQDKSVIEDSETVECTVAAASSQGFNRANMHEETTGHQPHHQLRTPENAEFVTAQLADCNIVSADVKHMEAAEKAILPEETERTNKILEAHHEKGERNTKMNASGQKRKMGSTRRTLRGNKGGGKNTEDACETGEEAEHMKEVRDEKLHDVEETKITATAEPQEQSREEEKGVQEEQGGTREEPSCESLIQSSSISNVESLESKVHAIVEVLGSCGTEKHTCIEQHLDSTDADGEGQEEGYTNRALQEVTIRTDPTETLYGQGQNTSSNLADPSTLSFQPGQRHSHPDLNTENQTQKKRKLGSTRKSPRGQQSEGKKENREGVDNGGMETTNDDVKGLDRFSAEETNIHGEPSDRKSDTVANNTVGEESESSKTRTGFCRDFRVSFMGEAIEIKSFDDGVSDQAVSGSDTQLTEKGLSEDPNVSDGHFDQSTSRRTEPVEGDTTNYTLQPHELRISVQDTTRENTEPSSPRRRRKMGSTRKTAKGRDRAAKIEENENEDTMNQNTTTGIDEVLNVQEVHGRSTSTATELEPADMAGTSVDGHLTCSSETSQLSSQLVGTSDDMVSEFLRAVDARNVVTSDNLVNRPGDAEQQPKQRESTSLAVKSLMPIISKDHDEEVHSDPSSPRRRRKMGSTRKANRGKLRDEEKDEKRESDEEARTAEGIESSALKETNAPKGLVTLKISAPQDTEENQNVEKSQLHSVSQQENSLTEAPQRSPQTGRRKMGSRRAGRSGKGIGATSSGELGDEGKQLISQQDPQLAGVDTSGGSEHPGERVPEEREPSPEEPMSSGLVSFGQIQSLGESDEGTRRKQKRDLESRDFPGFDSGCPLYNVVMIGDSSVGKTSFLQRFQSGMFSRDISATIGIDTCVQSVVVGNKRVRLQIWDTAGQERYRSITTQVFHKAQGLLLMYDITSSQTFQAVRNWITCAQERAPDDVIMMLLGNKNDCSSREVQPEQGESLAKEFNIHFMECSAATGANVSQAMEDMAGWLLQQHMKEEESLVLHKEKPQKKSGCC